MKNRNQIAQFIKYCIVGVMNTAITLGVIFLCKSVCGINPYVSNAIGYICGLINSFLWKKQWELRAGTVYGGKDMRWKTGRGVYFAFTGS